MRNHVLIALIACILIAGIGAYVAVKPSVTGNAAVVTGVYVTGTSIPYTCVLNLTIGWNLISQICYVDNSTLAEILSPINSSYDSVISYDPDEVPRWNTNKKDLPPWVFQNLTQISTKRGYWINITSNATLTVNGSIVTLIEISLAKGYNLVSYPVNRTNTVTDAFSSIWPAVISVETYNSTTKTYEIYDKRDPGNATLNYVSSGRGYWVNTTQDTTWVLVI